MDRTASRAGNSISTVTPFSWTVADLTEQASTLVQAVEETATDPEPVALRRTLHREIVDASTTVTGSPITAEGTIPDVEVMADEMLSSVFANLLINAVKHNDTAKPTVAVSATATEDDVFVRVADDGRGIPDDRRQAIFEQDTTLDGEGSGLGLYQIKTLVDHYGGDVWVEDRGAGRPKGWGNGSVAERSEGSDSAEGRGNNSGGVDGAFPNGTTGSVFGVKLRRA